MKKEEISVIREYKLGLSAYEVVREVGMSAIRMFSDGEFSRVGGGQSSPIILGKSDSAAIGTQFNRIVTSDP